MSAPNGVVALMDRSDGINVDMRVTNVPKGTYTIALSKIGATSVNDLAHHALLIEETSGETTKPSPLACGTIMSAHPGAGS
jgi:hypothetical protein